MTGKVIGEKERLVFLGCEVPSVVAGMRVRTSTDGESMTLSDRQGVKWRVSAMPPAGQTIQRLDIWRRGEDGTMEMYRQQDWRSSHEPGIALERVKHWQIAEMKRKRRAEREQTGHSR